MLSNSIHSTMQQAVESHQAGRLNDAEPLYRKVLAEQPNEPDALQLLGVLLSQLGRSREALALLEQAAKLRPQSPYILSNLGIALAQNGRKREAIEAFRSAVQFRPDHPAAKSNLADLLLEEGEALRRSGRLNDCLEVFEEARKLFPDRPETHNFLGVTLVALGRSQDAIDAFQKAISLRADYADPHNNLGLCFEGRGEAERAMEEYRTAIRLRPDFPGAFNNLGNLLKETDKPDQAIAAYRQALTLKPDYAQAMVGLAGAVEARGNTDEAIALYRQALANRPEAADVVETYLGNFLKNIGQVGEAVAAFRRAIQINPESSVACSNLVFTLWYDPSADSAEILAAHRQWDRRHAQPLRASIRPHGNDRDPNRRIKLGYVSADFRQHATAFCLVPLLSNHDHAAMEIACYASVKKPDPVTDRLRRCADRWIDCLGFSDEELAARVRDDQIDILVDLSMHTAGNRLALFARKPAPVQVAWVACPCTTGLETMDYRLTDPYLDPPGTDRNYSERSIRLPDSFWCYDPLTDEAPPVGPLPALQNGLVTFGCLNNVCKLNDGVLTLWSKVLKAIADSRLLMRVPDGSARRWAIQKLDVDPQRVRFVDRQPRLDYLRTYQQIDVMLDTVPYNGHMTSLDALWMGVPVVTLLGKTVVGRAGLSQLSNLGLQELVARDETQFVNLTVGLANDLPRLTQLRATLRGRMEKSPLMDGRRFAKNVESVYRQMWQTWCGQKS